MKEYYVYMISSISKTLYIWMTNNLERRIQEHKYWLIDWFSKKYKCNKLVYFESSNDVRIVIEREKQLKKRSRKKKISLIELKNSNWLDLSLNM